MLLTCEDFQRAGLWNTANCCPTCHSDDDLGFAMLDMYPEPYQHFGVRVYATVCCAHKQSREYSRDDWALAAWIKHNSEEKP